MAIAQATLCRLPSLAGRATGYPLISYPPTPWPHWCRRPVRPLDRPHHADEAAATEAALIGDVERLVRYARDLSKLANNFVAFTDFYTRRDKASFQAGTLYLDGRSCDLCVKVLDAGAPRGAGFAVGRVSGLLRMHPRGRENDHSSSLHRRGL